MNPLDLLQFKPGERFSVAAIKNKVIRAGCFDTWALANDFLARFAEWDHYICGNPIREDVSGKPEEPDITEGRWLLCDIDPGKADPAQTAEQILTYLNGWEVIHVDSGRGRQLWIRCDLSKAARERLLFGLRAKFNAKIDGTANLDRLMRLPGTVNSRTGRVASVVAHQQGDCLTSLAGFDFPPLPEVERTTSYDPGEPTDADRGLLKGEALSLWEETTPPDRSKRDFLFVLAVLRAGGPEGAACRLLYAMPGSKALEDRRGEAYWQSTLESVRKHMGETDRQRALAFSLAEKSKDDAGAPFEPDALRAVGSLGTADYQRVRSALKKAGVPVTALEKELAGDRKGPEREIVRHVVADGRAVGWFALTGGEWVQEPESSVRGWLRGAGYDTDVVCSDAFTHRWTLVNEPFAAEYPGDRRWNRYGARLAFEPEEGPHPTWDQIFDVCGRGLTPSVIDDEWCQEHGVGTGGDYLRLWAAALVQYPLEPLPYLFFFGPEKIGKSTFHEALGGVLLARGYMQADNAILSGGGFNGELEGAVLCYVEETDLSAKRKTTLNRIKSWVTGRKLTIHRKGGTPYTLNNSTHWVQTANLISYLPLHEGDTRITVIPAVEMEESERITRTVLYELLAAEGPQITHTLQTLTVPPATDRLRIPIVESAAKREQQAAARTLMEKWLHDNPGWVLKTDAEVVSAFGETLQAKDECYWPEHRILAALPQEGRRLQRLWRMIEGRPVTQPGELWEEIGRQLGFPNARTMGWALKTLATVGAPLSRSREREGTVWRQ